MAKRKGDQQRKQPKKKQKKSLAAESVSGLFSGATGPEAAKRKGK
ncbi:hypothetical protein [Pelagibacterium mangrovi]